MSLEELEKLEAALRKKIPHSRLMEVRETGEEEYEITMMDVEPELGERLDRCTELS